MANLASGLTPIEKDIWSNSSEATNGNISIYDGQNGFASAKNPNNYTLDLGKAQSIGIIRFLLWDGLGQPDATRDARQYFYRLFTSEDGKKWEFIWGTGHEGFNGWQVFEFQHAQKARFVRLECLLNSNGKPNFHIVEFEVHDSQPEELPSDRITNRRYISDSLQPLRNKINELVSSMEGKSKDIATFSQNATEWSKDIEAVHTRLKEQEKSIDEVVASFNEASKQLETIRADYATVSGNAEQSQTFLASVAEAQKEVTRLKTEIQQERTEVTGLINSVREFHTNTFIPIQNAIVQLNSEAANHASKAGQAAGQAEDFRNQGQTALQGVEQALHLSQERISSLEKVAEDVQKAFDRATNPLDGVQAKLDGINSVKGQIDTIAGEIKAAHEIASKQTTEISNLNDSASQILTEASGAKDKINTELTESSRLKDGIAKILELVSDTGRANSWDQRRKRAQYSAILWVVMTVVGVAISAHLVDKVFFTEDFKLVLHNEYVAFLLRLTLTAPGVFLAWFSATQYSKERLFLEQYEFKTAAALAMESYTELLQRNYPDQEIQTYNLTVELIRKVYKEPVYSKPSGSIWGNFKMPFAGASADFKVSNNPEPKKEG
jgi:uncharacterized coiled-coil DUF342 family protein